MRLVSLVPSLTHMICDLGLRPCLVGCTNFCVAPPGLGRSAARIGGTKDADINKIRALQPTHILANGEENTPEVIAACRALASTLVTLPKSPLDVPALLRQVGLWLACEAQSEAAAGRIEAALATLLHVRAARIAAWPPRRFLYFIWREPYMVASRDTYISAMLELLGWNNAAPESARYPAMSPGEIRVAAADAWLLSSEPYPFRKRDAERLRRDFADAPEILWCDGRVLSWYGTMTALALALATQAIAGGDTSLFKPF